MLLHPITGALEVVWDAGTDLVRHSDPTRRPLKSQEFRDAPFFHLILSTEPWLRARLEKGTVEPEFPIYQRFRKEGVTDYLAYFYSYGKSNRTV